MSAGTPAAGRSRYRRWSDSARQRLHNYIVPHETYVVVGAALACREDGVVHALLEILGLVRVLAEEDQTSTGTAERLVRRGRDDVAVLEGVRELASSDKTARVRDVGHEEGAVLICSLTKSLVVPVAGVSGGTADDETRLVDFGERLQVLVVNELRLGVKTVGKRLEVNGGSRHLLLRSL